MPRLRFSRDERGYEHTFLVHTTGRRGRERTRLLYWFRSPPAVRVGRPALDPDAIRAIEQANPEIAFDWPAILEARQPEPEPAEGWRARRGRVRDGYEAAARESNASVADPQPTGVPLATSGDVAGSDPAETGKVTADDPAGSLEADLDQDVPVIEPSAVQRVLGSEGLLRVRGRYAEVLARIATQVTDAAVADELRSIAEHLNPDAWVTEHDVAIGLEGFERVLENVRQRLGPPHRRRRGAQPAAPASASAVIGGEDATVPAPYHAQTPRPRE